MHAWKMWTGGGPSETGMRLAPAICRVERPKIGEKAAVTTLLAELEAQAIQELNGLGTSLALDAEPPAGGRQGQALTAGRSGFHEVRLASEILLQLARGHDLRIEVPHGHD
jgi:hypothetical protein